MFCFDHESPFTNQIISNKVYSHCLSDNHLLKSFGSNLHHEWITIICMPHLLILDRHRIGLHNPYTTNLHHFLNTLAGLEHHAPPGTAGGNYNHNHHKSHQHQRHLQLRLHHTKFTAHPHRCLCRQSSLPISPRFFFDHPLPTTNHCLTWPTSRLGTPLCFL